MEAKKCLPENRRPDLGELFKEYPQTDAERDVRAWLKKCRHIFTEAWEIGEILEMAAANEFDRVAVISVLSHWNCALAGSRFENIQAMNAYRLESAIYQFMELKSKLEYVPELDLRPQWKAVNEFLFEGIEFKEVA